MLKLCTLFSLCACAALAGDFVTGQAARLLIGQTTFTSQTPGASDTLLGAAGGIAWANGTLFVADSNRLGLTPINNRVLQIPTTGFPAPLDKILQTGNRCPVCVGQANVVLGQPDFTSTGFATAQNALRLPTGVATDGHILVVADTGNNRVLIWKSIPTSMNQPADIELGQTSFTSLKTGSDIIVDNRSFRAPQGVWVQNGKLFVADTQNYRVMIWNSIPTQNNQPADLELGQPNFNTVIQPDLTKQSLDAQQNSLLNPVSVTSDGTRLYVADLGHNRVLIWNSIPTQMQQPADVVIGQKDFLTAIGNDSPELCASNGMDASGNPTYPDRCGKTLDFPRFALSDGRRLFIADGGNDRVLIYNTIPTQNTPSPDIILGQIDDVSDAVSSFTDIFHPLLRQSAADLTPTPTSLAWDGTNLYVADPSNRRILAFSVGEFLVPINGIRNAASMEVFALGTLQIAGNITAGDVLTATINGIAYNYTIVSGDTVETASKGLIAVINAGDGDPVVFAQYEPTLQLIKLLARKSGTAGNSVSLAVSTSDNSATTVLVASGTTLFGGENAAILAPGALVAVFGSKLADLSASADLSQEQLPLDLAGVEVYCDGQRLPLLYVSSTQINTQIPFVFDDTNNSSCYVRTEHLDGSVVTSTAIAVPIDHQNPGIFAFPGQDPRQAVAFHASSFAVGTVDLEGVPNAGDQAVVTIENRTYTYTAQPNDTLNSVRDGIVAVINANPHEKVVAYPVAAFTRFQIRAKIAGPEGEGINFLANATDAQGTNVGLQMINLQSSICCANRAGAPVTVDNPAAPGEMILVYATGLGLVGPDDATAALVTGAKYRGPDLNDPKSFVSSLSGGATANVIAASVQVGAIGVYKVLLQLGPETIANDLTQLTIAQDIYTSNIVTIPVNDPNASPAIDQ